MNRSSVMTHGALLGASLLAAYLVWTREPSTDKEDEINVLSFRSLDQVAFSSPERKVQIKREKDDHGTYCWVRVEEQRKKPKSPPPRATVTPPPAPPDRAKSAVGSPPGHTSARTPAPAAKPAAKTTPVKAPPRAAKAAPKTKKEPASLAQDPKADPDKEGAVKTPRAVNPAAAPARPAAPGSSAAQRPAAAPAPAPAPAPAAAPAAPPAPVKEETVTEVKEFIASDACEELLKTLSELPAARALGKLGQDKLKEFGLSESQTTLALRQGSTTRTFAVGDRTYGNLDYYLQDGGDKQVYVVKQDLVERVKNAQSRLFSPNLHEFLLADIDRVVVSSAGKSKTLIQHDRAKGPAAYWTDEEASDSQKGNDSYRNWVGKLDALRVSSYSERAAPPAGLKEVARIDYHKGSSKEGYLVLYEKPEAVPPASPGAQAPSAPPSATAYYAKSEYTRVPVELFSARAEEVVKGLAEVLR